MNVSWLHINIWAPYHMNGVSITLAIHPHIVQWICKQMVSFVIVIIDIFTQKPTSTHGCPFTASVAHLSLSHFRFHEHIYCNRGRQWNIVDAYSFFSCIVLRFFVCHFMCIWLAPLIFTNSISKCLSNTCFILASLFTHLWCKFICLSVLKHFYQLNDRMKFRLILIFFFSRRSLLSTLFNTDMCWWTEHIKMLQAIERFHIWSSIVMANREVEIKKFDLLSDFAHLSA